MSSKFTKIELDHLQISTKISKASSSIHSYPHPKFCALQSKFAFIEYENDADAEKAKEELSNKDMYGLKIRIGKFSYYPAQFYRMEQKVKKV